MTFPDATACAGSRVRTLRPARRATVNVALFLAGGAIYYLGYKLSLPTRCLTTVWALMTTADDAIGWVFYPLLGATVYLIALVGRHAMARLGRTQRLGADVGKYAVIEWVAPLLGLLGTVTALASAMKGLDLSMGVSDAMAALNLKVGQALNSTIYGVSLAIVAGLLRSMSDGRKGGVSE